MLLVKYGIRLLLNISYMQAHYSGHAALLSPLQAHLDILNLKALHIQVIHSQQRNSIPHLKACWQDAAVHAPAVSGRVATTIAVTAP